MSSNGGITNKTSGYSFNGGIMKKWRGSVTRGLSSKKRLKNSKITLDEWQLLVLK
jgi:hypothetical protein